MRALFEQYRPRTWEDVVGHGTVKAAVRRMVATGGLGGRAFWLSGLSGTGKTTLAYLIAGEVCDPDNFEELDAGEVTPARIEELERRLRCRCLGEKTGRAVLVNEAHALRRDTIRKLLVVLERIPNHVTWVFTTTTAGQLALFDGIDAHPLLSRCVEFKLDAARYAKAFAERAQQIAETEGLGGATQSEYMALVKECNCNLRQVLSRIEAGQMLREALV